MDGGVEAGQSAQSNGQLAQLVAALRGIEDNIVFRAWCLSRGRDVKRRWWRHPVVTPLAMLGACFLVILGHDILAANLYYGSPVGTADLIPVLSVLWVLPLVYGAVQDSLRMMGSERISAHWDEFVVQLQVTPVDNHEFLIAAFRICWPRLLMAAVGSGVSFWLLAMWRAGGIWHTSSVAYSDLVMYGTPMAGLLVFTGALTGVAVILASLTLGRSVSQPGLVASGSVLYCLVCLVTAFASLDAKIFDPAQGWIRLYPVSASYGWNYDEYQWNYFDLQLLLVVVLPVTVVLIGLAALALRAAARNWSLRSVLLVVWPLALPVTGLLLYTVVSKLNLYDCQGTTAQATVWIASLTSLMSAGLNPAGIISGWSSLELQFPHMDNGMCWVRFLLQTVCQLGLIAVLYHFALDAIHRWRRGEE